MNDNNEIQRELSTEDFLAEGTQEKQFFKIEAEYVSLRQTLYGTLSIIQSSNGSATLVFKSSELSIRPDLKLNEQEKEF